MKWKSYFQYSKTERWGALVLLSIALGLWIFPALWSYYHEPVRIIFEPIVVEPRLPQEQSTPQQAIVEPSAVQQKMDSLQPFNANDVSAEALQQMGLSAKVAHRWCTFRSKMGGFTRLDQIQKIYGLKEADFKRLRPFMRLTEDQKDFILTETPPLKAADPNTADAAALQQMGLNKRQAEQLLRYRNKGGTFRYKSDLKRLYSIDASSFERIQAYIDLPEKRVVESLNINTATAEEWQLLKGIGPTYAKRIIHFRKALGGFHSVAQVGETFGLPDSTFQAIQAKLRCTAAEVQKISINKASYEELKAHPYLSWSHAKAIVRYREEQGFFEQIEQLQILGTFDDGKNTFHKIKPYLTL